MSPRVDFFGVARTGRRPGRPDTRSDIVAAAAHAFSTSGYDATSMRTVAAAAGVDPALVRRFFGNKEGLFTAVAETAWQPRDAVATALEGPPGEAGDRLLRYYLQLLGDVERPGPMLGLIRSAVSSEYAAELLRGFLAEQILGRIAAHLTTDRPELRACLAASQLVGLAVARYAVKLEPLVSASPEDLADLVAPTLQRYLTGDSRADGGNLTRRPPRIRT
jgi:AcrR family transcriptional regulator